MSPSVSVAEQVVFTRDVQPILEQHCAACHAGEKRKGGLSINTRESLLTGGESGPAINLEDPLESELYLLITEEDAETRMPPENKDPLSVQEIATLTAWITQGVVWPEDFTFGVAPHKAPLLPRDVELPEASPDRTHPIDRLLAWGAAEHQAPADDHTFIRRAHLDLIGLPPTIDEVQRFAGDRTPDKHARLIDDLLARDQAYTEHWLTFWSDMLRSAYKGTGYIDGGRKRIDTWLYTSLYQNKPYDRLVAELVTGANGSAGFINGIRWRGEINESQRTEMQAAQNVAQVFMGTNLKCASCHDSFINDWKLADAYALANVFSDNPLELHRCDKPTGVQAAVGFIYPELGAIDANAPRSAKMQQLADILVAPENGRLTRTIVNRLWARFMGRGIVEPVDEMDQPPFNADLLDWLAADLAEHGYDLKHTMRRICTSRAYRAQAVSAPRPGTKDFAFQGPLVKRMSAEVFVDAVCTLTSDWPEKPAARLPRASPTDAPRSQGVRQSLVHADALTRVLGRPNREQVVTRRESAATTLQMIELTNGSILDQKLRRGADTWIQRSAASASPWVDNLYLTALGRIPTATEREIAQSLAGKPASPHGVADLLWSLVMSPEFQLIR